MSDNLKIRRPQDPKQVNVNETWELTYWTKHFNVNAEELKRAVRSVGTHVDKIKKYLGK